MKIKWARARDKKPEENIPVLGVLIDPLWREKDKPDQFSSRFYAEIIIWNGLFWELERRCPDPDDTDRGINDDVIAWMKIPYPVDLIKAEHKKRYDKWMEYREKNEL